VEETQIEEMKRRAQRRTSGEEDTIENLACMKMAKKMVSMSDYYQLSVDSGSFAAEAYGRCVSKCINIQYESENEC
jgi:hypothetical protein